MSQDAGIDIDFDDPASMDRELARLQAQAHAQAQAQQVREAGDEKQAKVIEGQVAEDGKTVEFMGRRFRVAEKIGAMPLLKFSMYADMSVQDPRALGAMYAMLRDCIHPGTPGCGECEACKADRERDCKDYDPGDWAAFEDHAMESRAEADDLLDVITKTMELISGRPTGPSSPSQGGRRGISAGSTDRSSGRRGGASRR